MFQDRDEELKRLEQALLEEDKETEEAEEEEEETEEEWEEEEEATEDEEAEDTFTPQPQNPRFLIAMVLLVTAGVLLFLAYLLAKKEGLL